MARLKKRVQITLSPEIVEKARRYHINISAVAEQALVEIIRKWELVEQMEEKNPSSASSDQNAEGGEGAPGLGFEPRRGCPQRLSRPADRALRFPKLDDTSLSAFKQFLDLRGLSEATIKRHMNAIRHIYQHVGKRPTVESVRTFMYRYKETHAANSYNNLLKALNIYLRDFLRAPEILDALGLKFLPHDRPVNHKVPTLEQLRIAFDAMPTIEAKTIFLFYATTGLRRSEVLELKWENLIPELRAVLPDHWTRTKRGGVTFYNAEAEAWLQAYKDALKGDISPSEPIFHTSKKRLRAWFEVASERAGISITPQILRVWFAMEMRARGVADSFIDVFQGRAGKSVLARYYTDRTALRLLKEVYDKAELKLGVPLPLGKKS